MSDNTRAAFEAFISSPPFEEDIRRFPNDPIKFAWPGNYRSIDVDRCWESWKASRLQAIEEAAKVADGFVDATEERRAHVASNMQDGTIGDQLSRLKHHQTVSMWNTALRRTAAAIRNLTHSEDGKA